MEDNILTTVLMPLSLAIIMVGLGLSLTIRDFVLVVKEPKAVLLGMFNQLILLPLLALGIVYTFNVEPMIAIGIMLISACPGGPTSNLISYVARGDIALSITLTAIASVITVFTIPVIMNLVFGAFGEGPESISLPILETISKVLLITLIPVVIGMTIHYFKPQLAQRLEKPSRIFSTVLFIVIILGVIVSNKDNIWQQFKTVGPPMIVLNILTMGLGYYLAKVMNLPKNQQISISIESGIQNGTLAIVIAASILGNINYGIPAAAYGLIMFTSAGFMMYKFGRK